MKGLISLLVGCCTVAIAENSTQWIYPPGIPTTFSDPPLTYHYGDTVKVSWMYVVLCPFINKSMLLSSTSILIDTDPIWLLALLIYLYISKVPFSTFGVV